MAKKTIYSKPISVVIEGGEQLSIFNKLKPAILLLKENNIHISINLNSTLCTLNDAKFISDNIISLFDSLPCPLTNINDKITNTPRSYN